MKLSYNVTGQERKSLVGAISKELNAPAKYLGAPSFAYEVGGYNIDKVGTVTGADNPGLEDALRQAGFNATEREYDKPSTYESGFGDTGAPESPEEADAVQETPEQYAEREMRRLKLEDENVPDYSNRGQYGGDVPESYTYKAELSDPDCPDRMEVFGAENDVDAIRQAYEFCEGDVLLLELFQLDGDYNTVRQVEITPDPCRLTVEIPLDGFTPEKLGNLAKLVRAKEWLLKAALGAAKLPIQQTNDTLRFPWFRGDGPVDAEHTAAYCALVSLLCKTAIEKKRVTAKEKDVEGSPKYAMRCFLLSLGFIGDEYKAARKILLSRLDGNSSWKNGKKTGMAVDGGE